VDFDGTLCQSKYPFIGEPIQEVIDYVKNLAENGNQLILWTCRVGDKLDEAVEWCKKQGIEFDSINENLQSAIDEWGSDTRKISAYRYIDDKAIDVDSIIAGKGVKQTNKNNKVKQMWEFKQAAQADTLNLYIYGDVEDVGIDWVNMTYIESENSAKYFREELSAHPDTKQINIYINSYGGSVFEGTAIYNQLKRHPAQKTVYIDGFACSVASIIAMAGDKIVMPKNAMMMIHNMWNIVMGNAKELRKAADDLDTISEGNRQAYLQKAGDKLTEADLIKMLDAETWLTAEQCIEYGLADEYAEKDADLTKSKEMLQKANLLMTQHIEFNKSLAAQLRELVEPLKEEPAAPKENPEEEPKAEPVEPVETADPIDEPKENKTLKFILALNR